MKYADVAVPRKGIFFYLARDFPLVTIEEMDIAFYSKFSQRTLSPFLESLAESHEGEFTEDDWTLIANSIKVNLVGKWNKLEKVLEEEYNLLDTFYEHIEEETSNTSETNKDDNTVDNKDIYGFDSVDGVPDTKSTTDYNSTINSTQSGSRISDIKGNLGSVTPQTMLKLETELWNDFNYHSNVLSDVANLMLVKVY